MTVNKFLLLAATVLLAVLGCAGADWFIEGHKNLIVALAGFAGACYTLAQAWPLFQRSP